MPMRQHAQSPRPAALLNRQNSLFIRQIFVPYDVAKEWRQFPPPGPLLCGAGLTAEKVILFSLAATVALLKATSTNDAEEL